MKRDLEQFVGPYVVTSDLGNVITEQENLIKSIHLHNSDIGLLNFISTKKKVSRYCLRNNYFGKMLVKIKIFPRFRGVLDFESFLTALPNLKISK